MKYSRDEIKTLDQLRLAAAAASEAMQDDAEYSTISAHLSAVAILLDEARISLIIRRLNLK